jgi:c(7)-type cytochrome triheme protein
MLAGCAVFGIWGNLRAEPPKLNLSPRAPESAPSPRTLVDTGMHRVDQFAHSVVYPKQELPIRFNHGQHLAKGMVCQTCHREIDTSEKASDLNLPRGEACDACHGDSHPRPSATSQPCNLCHVQADASRVRAVSKLPTPRLRFNHARHSTAGVSCDRCHGDFRKVGLATREDLPSEASCLSCHDGEKLSDRCDTCHPADLSGRLVTQPGNDRSLPPLLPKGEHGWGMTHDLAFVNQHQQVARARPGACETCHAPSFCLDCHAGNVRPMKIHAGNFSRTHGFEAQLNPQRCTACHVQQVDCRACHERVGLSTTGDLAAFGVGKPGSFHPFGFGSGPAHAEQAQRNIGSCISCHGEDTCLSCHATTKVALPGNNVSPHGPGYAHSLRCAALERANRRVCLKCHEPGSPRLACQ